jgi:FkbM family methyltransferase
MSAQKIIHELSGNELMQKVVVNDYLLYNKNFIADTIVIVGGHVGNILNNFYKHGIRPKKIIIFEPVKEFTDILFAKKDYFEKIFPTEIEIIDKALYISEENMEMIKSGDGSTFSYTKRDVKKRSDYAGEIEVRCFHVKNLNDLLTGEVSFYFNCEGAEYKIIDMLLNNTINFKIKSMNIQTHKVWEINDNPYLSLYDLRKQLVIDFAPVITFDWAFDVWVSKRYFDFNPGVNRLTNW